MALLVAPVVPVLEDSPVQLVFAVLKVPVVQSVSVVQEVFVDQRECVVQTEHADQEVLRGMQVPVVLLV